MTVAQILVVLFAILATVAASSTVGAFVSALRESHPALWEGHLRSRWFPGTSLWSLSRFIRSPEYAQLRSPRLRVLGTRFLWLERATLLILLALFVYSVLGVSSIL